MVSSRTELNRISDTNLIRQSIPDHVRSDKRTFADFISAYYEFLHQKGYPLDVVNNLVYYKDIDETLDEFVDYFINELMPTIPREMVADRKLLAKNIIEFYKNKGNEASYRFLFRVLYNEDLNFYYPKDDILRLSDGKWEVRLSLKIVDQDYDLNMFIGRQIEGQTSETLALVEDAIKINEAGVDIIELSISDIRGSGFMVEEDIGFFQDDSENPQLFSLMLVVISASVLEGGAGYFVNDPVFIRDYSQNIIGYGFVSSIQEGEISNVLIDQEGENYRGSQRIVEILENLPVNYSGEIIVYGDSNDSNIDSNGIIFQDTVDSIEDYTFEDDFTLLTFDAEVDNITLEDTADTFRIVDSVNEGVREGFGYISLVGSTGNILEIVVEDFGDTFESSRVVIESDTGTGGRLVTDTSGGAALEVQLQSFPGILPIGIVGSTNESVLVDDGDEFFIVDEDEEYIIGLEFNYILDMSQSGNGLAVGILNAGFMIEYPGQFLNNDGHLSSDKYIQDSFFYQDFSYVLRSPVSNQIWTDIIKETIHPAGLKMFGELFVTRSLEVNTNIPSNTIVTIS